MCLQRFDRTPKRCTRTKPWRFIKCRYLVSSDTEAQVFIIIFFFLILTDSFRSSAKSRDNGRKLSPTSGRSSPSRNPGEWVAYGSHRRTNSRDRELIRSLFYLADERRKTTRDTSLVVSFICKVGTCRHARDVHMKKLCLTFLLLCFLSASPQERKLLSSSSQRARSARVSRLLNNSDSYSVRLLTRTRFTFVHSLIWFQTAINMEI